MEPLIHYIHILVKSDMSFAAWWFMVGQDKNVAQIFLNYENS